MTDSLPDRSVSRRLSTDTFSTVDILAPPYALEDVQAVQQTRLSERSIAGSASTTKIEKERIASYRYRVSSLEIICDVIWNPLVRVNDTETHYRLIKRDPLLYELTGLPGEMIAKLENVVELGYSVAGFGWTTGDDRLDVYSQIEQVWLAWLCIGSKAHIMGKQLPRKLIESLSKDLNWAHMIFQIFAATSRKHGLVGSNTAVSRNQRNSWAEDISKSWGPNFVQDMDHGRRNATIHVSFLQGERVA